MSIKKILALTTLLASTTVAQSQINNINVSTYGSATSKNRYHNVEVQAQGAVPLYKMIGVHGSTNIQRQYNNINKPVSRSYHTYGIGIVYEERKDADVKETTNVYGFGVVGGAIMTNPFRNVNYSRGLLMGVGGTIAQNVQLDIRVNVLFSSIVENGFDIVKEKDLYSMQQVAVQLKKIGVECTATQYDYENTIVKGTGNLSPKGLSFALNSQGKTVRINTLELLGTYTVLENNYAQLQLIAGIRHATPNPISIELFEASGPRSYYAGWRVSKNMNREKK